MLLIAGAILINAACALIASGEDTFDKYALSRILIAIGAGLMAMDLVLRLRKFQAGHSRSPHQPAESGAAEKIDR